MTTNTSTSLDIVKYDSAHLDRVSTASSHKKTTIMKYIAPRVVGVNHPSTFQGSLRNFAMSKPGVPTTSVGLASLVHHSALSSMSPIQRINGDRTIDEQRDLSRVTQTLADKALQCSDLDAHNRALEMQIEWLERHANKNTATIAEMFQTETQSAQQLQQDATRHTPELERKLKDVHRTTVSNDEHYQKLLAKRNSLAKDIFGYQRQMAQNRAESEFLTARLQQFTDEVQFYTVKNDSLHARQVKLRYELDEERFALQVLQMECQVMENEKITNEDTHAAELCDIQSSINVQQIAGMQPSKYYREQLHHELRRMRVDYEKKIEVYRDELHRQYELERHRLEMHKLRPAPGVTKEQDQILEQYRREKQETDQQIAAIRGRIHDVEAQIRTVEQRFGRERNNKASLFESQKHFTANEKLIHERERQLNEATRIRIGLKKQIEDYRREIDRYQLVTEPGAISQLQTPLVSTWNALTSDHRPKPSVRPSSPPSRIQSARQDPGQSRPSRRIDVSVEQDCADLYRLFNEPRLEEKDIISILAHRRADQRDHIREAFRHQFSEDLDDIIERRMQGSLKKILQSLLLSSVELDCYEIRRVCRAADSADNTLVEIFLTNSSRYLRHVSETFLRLFNQTLQQGLSNEPTSYAQLLCRARLQANPPDGDDEDQVMRDARLLHERSGKWSIDESTFTELVSKRSCEHLKQIFAAYQQFSGTDIEQSIKAMDRTDVSRTMMATVRLVRHRTRYFAYELRKALKGPNTNEDYVNRVIISRGEIDLTQIKIEYEKIAKCTLYDQIQSDTSGNYKRVLLDLVRQRVQAPESAAAFRQLVEPPTLPKKQNLSRPSAQWKRPGDQPRAQRDLSEPRGRTTLIRRNDRDSSPPTRGYIDRTSTGFDTSKRFGSSNSMYEN